MKPSSSFADLTRDVHLIKDLILSNVTHGHDSYEQETLDFSKNLLATKNWFERISYANKKKYVLALLQDVRSAWTLSLLLKSMWNCRPKDAVMSISETPIFSVYDQVPIDHNRTVQSITVLAQAMINSRQWFHTLDPESQAMALAELVMVAGGPIMWEVLRKAQSIYHQHRNEQLHKLLECIVAADTDVADVKNKTSKVTLSSPTRAAPAAPSETGDSPIKTLPKTPIAQLDAALVVWNFTIKSIRDSEKLEEVEMTLNDGSIRKLWKINRAKPEGTETVDLIQMLPAAIGKRILSYLSRAQLLDYAKVNKYWAFLVDELRGELAARDKLKNDLQKLQDLMIKHDTSLDDLHTNVTGGTGYNTAPSSVSIGVFVGPLSKKGRLSVMPSVKSAGAYSFRHVIEKLTPEIRRHKPIRNMADLSDRLELRGAVDENLWIWCANILKHCKKDQTEQEEEGVLRFKEMNFPCPLMKSSIEIPLKCYLVKDPSYVGPIVSKKARIVSTAVMNVPKEDTKRYSLWSRDFSSLYKVFKVASYQSPV